MKTFKIPLRYVPIAATISVFCVVYLIGIICYDGFGVLSIFDLLQDNSYLGIAAIGTALVILTGGIDLSVGSVIAFTTILIAKILVAGGNAFLAISLALALGTLFGFCQGCLIHYFSLPPFLLTLAGMFFVRGCAFVVNVSDVPIKRDAVFDFVTDNLSISIGSEITISFYVVVYIVLLIAAIIFSQRTRAGRNIYAIGDNELAATLMGIPVGRTKIMTYTIAGFCYALGGVAFAFYLKSGYASHCVGMEMEAIAAVVIGGTLLTGGVGYIFGSFFGVLVLGLITALITYDGLDSCWSRIIVGLLMLVFIFMQNMITKISKSKSKSH